MKPESKYNGALVLSAIGDALGWITEFEKSSASLKHRYAIESIDSFIDWEKNVGGRFWGYKDSIKSGSYSDDTQLMLSVARSIRPDGMIDLEYFSKVELPCWLQYARGGGRTVKQAAEKIKRKSTKWNSNFFSYKIKDKKVDYRDSGANGAAMRVLPIALASLADEKKTLQNVFNNSIVTHGHPRAIIGAMLYCYSAQQFLVRTPEDFDPLNLITQLGKDFQKRFSVENLITPQVQEWIRKWNKGQIEPFSSVYAKTLEEAQAQLRIIYQGVRDKSDDQDILKKLGCYDPSTKGSGIATVNAGIFLACKYNDDPAKAILSAVNSFGTDTDSIASFVGGMLGGLYGLQCVPNKWRTVQDYDYLLTISERLLAISEETYLDSKTTPNDSITKSLDTFEADDFKEGDAVFCNALGAGLVGTIDRQNTLTRGKYNLLLHIKFESGQTCIFNKLFDQSRDYEDGQ